MLFGDLGGGKTQFVKGLAKGLGIEEDITSPTFTFERVYEAGELTLYHFDLYRSPVLDPDIELAIKESVADPKGVTAIEWAERAEQIWPTNAKKMNFHWISETERKIEVN